MLDHHASSFERDDIEATMSGVVELESGVVVWLVQTTETQLRPATDTDSASTAMRARSSAATTAMRSTPARSDKGAPPLTHPYPAAERSPYAELLQSFVDAIAGDARTTTGRASAAPWPSSRPATSQRARASRSTCASAIPRSGTTSAGLPLPASSGLRSSRWRPRRWPHVRRRQLTEDFDTHDVGSRQQVRHERRRCWPCGAPGASESAKASMLKPRVPSAISHQS